MDGEYNGEIAGMEDIMRIFSIHLREISKNNIQRMRECYFAIDNSKLFSIIK